MFSSIFSRVIAGVITASVIGAASFIPGALQLLNKSAAIILAHLTSITGLPNWGLYLLIAMSIPTCIQLKSFVIMPKGKLYKSDEFFGCIWKWEYSRGQLHNIVSFCPECDTMLVCIKHRGFGSITLTCENCNRDILHHEGTCGYLIEKVSRLIDRKIRAVELEPIYSIDENRGNL